MGTSDIGTAKYQSKRLKAAGLQKLKYYCQICEKQCRDENGFKNHLASPSHKYKIENLSASTITNYSHQFETEFLRLLRVNHGTKNINANKFYQEYILTDKNHVHLNSTRWRSLTQFIKYLGTNGKVRVDNETEEDEFSLSIRLVGVSGPDKSEKKVDEEKKRERFISRQIELGREEERRQQEQQQQQQQEQQQNNQGDQAQEHSQTQPDVNNILTPNTQTPVANSDVNAPTVKLTPIHIKKKSKPKRPSIFQ